MDRRWQEHLDALKRFNAWEAEELRRRPTDYSRALAWLSEAWELAARYGPGEDATARRDRHLLEILETRRSLERARISP
ncbi:MAG: hypothetical protein HZC42_06505 [Candidatus Eisenbacteria bacterium]|nr:hypothetical protein [Candidatus Eisenbacteria bacterium]